MNPSVPLLSSCPTVIGARLRRLPPKKDVFVAFPECRASRAVRDRIQGRIHVDAPVRLQNTRGSISVQTISFDGADSGGFTFLGDGSSETEFEMALGLKAHKKVIPNIKPVRSTLLEIKQEYELIHLFQDACKAQSSQSRYRTA